MSYGVKINVSAVENDGQYNVGCHYEDSNGNELSTEKTNSSLVDAILDIYSEVLSCAQSKPDDTTEDINNHLDAAYDWQEQLELELEQCHAQLEDLYSRYEECLKEVEKLETKCEKVQKKSKPTFSDMHPEDFLRLCRILGC